MSYPIRTEGDYTVVALSGEIDLYYSPQAREQILRYLNEGRNVLVDLSAVDYIDSSGVASLVEGYQVAKRKQVRFALIGVSQAALKVLQLARLDRVFPIYASVADCVADG